MVRRLRYHQRKRRNQQRTVMRRSFFGLVIFLIIVYLVFFGLGQVPFFRIDEIEIEGGETIDNNEAIAVIDELVEGSFIPFAPLRHHIFFPRKKVKEALYENFSRVESIELIMLEKSMRVEMLERAPNFVVCRDAALRNCWYGDDAGSIFQTAPSYTPGVYLQFIDENLNPESLPYESIDHDELIMYQNFRERIQENDTDIEVIDISDDILTSYAIDRLFGVRVSDESRIFTQKYNIAEREESYEELLVILELVRNKHEEFIERLIQNADDFEYLDISVPNKVYFKFAQQELADESDLELDINIEE